MGPPPNLFFSDDYGATWTNATGVTEHISDFYIFNVNQSAWVYALPSEEDSTSVYISIDNGVSFSHYNVDYHLSEIILHPTHPERFIGLVMEMVYGENDDNMVEVTTALFGQVTVGTPQIPLLQLESGVLSIGFFQPSREMPHCGANIIYLTRILVDTDVPQQNINFMRLNYPYAAEDRESLMDDAFHYEQVGQYLFVTQFVNNGQDNLALYVSTNMGTSFSRAQFPFEGLENLYTYVDGTEDLALIAVQETVENPIGTCTVMVQSPAGFNLSATKADFTPSPNFTGAVNFAFVGFGCAPMNGVTGCVVVADRGNCSFLQKVQMAVDAGALGVVVVNNVNQLVIMGAPAEAEPVDYPRIPAFLVTQSSGAQIKAQISAGTTTGLLLEDQEEERALYNTSVLYNSGPDGLHYTTALKDVVDFGTFENSLIDVYKVQSSNSTYIANYYDGVGVRSVITFDKGALWSSVVDNNCPANTGCTITLALEASNRMDGVPMPHSLKEAAGLILANGFGSQDEVLLPNSQTANLYWSKDGGHTWSQVTSVAEGPHHFRILDNGGVIVAAPMGVQTSTIYYSVFPANFLPITIASPITISGIVTEPETSTTVAFVYSQDADNWNGISLDFDNLFPTQCTPPYSQPDFGHVAMFDSVTAPLAPELFCIDGFNAVYYRRNCNVMCSLGFNFQARVQPSAPCACSHRDFKCAPGFVRAYPVDNASSICSPDPFYVLQGNCQPGQLQFDAPRYETVPGDACVISAMQTDAYLGPRPLPCPHAAAASASGSSRMTAGVVAGIVLASLMLAGTIVYIFALSISPTVRLKSAQFLGIGRQQSCLSRTLANLKMFRATRNFQYSILAHDAGATSAVDEDEDDDILFGADAQLKA